MKYHEMNKKEVVEALNTDLSSGLTDSDVKKRLKQHGNNELDEGEKQSALLLFFSQFKDFMVLSFTGCHTYFRNFRRIY